MAPPSFGLQQYWNDRYTKAPKAYDWLNHADVLDGDLDKALKSWQLPFPRILHIGCGNSELSFDLRLKVRDPAQIHNIDYSAVVIEWGRDREKTMFDSRWDDASDSAEAPSASQATMPMMEWDEVDLLSLQSIITSCPLGAYAVIIDKSTCDSLACTSTTELSIPYFLYTAHDEDISFLDITKSYAGTANAVQVLAVHLALLAAPKATWIAYSYSSTRFWFLDPNRQERDNINAPLALHSGLPDPRDLWTMTEHREIIRPYGTTGETTSGQAGDTHFIYIMQRTDVALRVRTMSR